MAGKRTAGARTKARAEKAPAGKDAGGRAAAAGSGQHETAARAAGAGKAAPGRSAAKEAAAKRSAARKATAAKAGRKAAPAASAAEQTGDRTVAAKKTADMEATAGAGVPPARGLAEAAPEELAVRPGEEPWTSEEVAGARAELEGEVQRLQHELAASETALTGLMRDSGDGAGHDEADTGTKNITREHEMALAANARATLEQTEHALERLDTGTYGLCEVCGKPIGKARMQAFPRATLCVEDKQKQERRG
ncbi:DNA-binding protein [Streptomyces sp. CC53]|nr:DNA-binding protein [Streptomyces sp. CC53]